LDSQRGGGDACIAMAGRRQSECCCETTTGPALCASWEDCAWALAGCSWAAASTNIVA